MVGPHIPDHQCDRAARPYIIWTVQRTGGTNLAKRLDGLWVSQSTLHEPFMPTRVFGGISKAWSASENRAELYHAVRTVISRNPIIKHCVDTVPRTVPWEVTKALASASVEAGYRHLFLYRRSAFDRLLSLFFAGATGVWMADQIPVAEAVARFDALTGSAEPKAPGSVGGGLELPVDALVQHEQSCIARLQTIWNHLVSHGADVLSVAYEDIYASPDATFAETSVGTVRRFLGIELSEAEARAWSERLLDEGDQGTRDLYSRIPGYNDLASRCYSLPRLQLVCGRA